MTAARLRTVSEALADVLARARHLPPRPVAIDEALGLILADEILADLDLPPFDKALVDGFALQYDDTPRDSWEVIGEVLAGGTFEGSVGPGQAVSIMTGAPLPDGADSVVMVEKTKVESGRVRVSGSIAKGQNRLLKARELRRGDRIFEAGVRLNAPRLGVLASLGRSRPLVIPRPRVAVLSTGDEIVPIEAVPGPGQIRNSNSTLLASLVRSFGADAWVSPVAPDDPDRLEALLAEALDGSTNGGRRPDVLLISGGVSAGTRDLVPSTLARLGVEEIFHKVDVKPGKPLWFGVRPGDEGGSETLVFGLPGNPVSGAVSVLLFVQPALAALSGSPVTGPSGESLPLAVDFSYREDRPTYHPARLVGPRDGGRGAIEPLRWAGSSDLRTVALADGFVALAPGEHRLEAGTRLGFLRLP